MYNAVLLASGFANITYEHTRQVDLHHVHVGLSQLNYCNEMLLFPPLRFLSICFTLYEHVVINSVYLQLEIRLAQWFLPCLSPQ